MSARGLALVAATAAVLIAVFLFTPPIPQDPAYHDFADSRTLLGVPNFWNVASNLPFLVVGLFGITVVLRRDHVIIQPGLETAYVVFFSGIFLTAFGSGWYHLVPGNDSLVWDRLPMTVGFAGLFAIIVGEFISASIGRAIVVPLLLAGVASVEYWAWTEARGLGDLRPYAIVQFLPMALIPFILLLYRPAVGTARHFWWMLLFYVLAKIAEFFDGPVFALGGVVSGHTVKHLFAAVTPAILVYALLQRSARPSRPSGSGRPHET